MVEQTQVHDLCQWLCLLTCIWKLFKVIEHEQHQVYNYQDSDESHPVQVFLVVSNKIILVSILHMFLIKPP
jgi:hypothetical protein